MAKASVNKTREQIEDENLDEYLSTMMKEEGQNFNNEQFINSQGYNDSDDYQDLIDEEDEFDEELKQILKIVETSPMMSLSMGNEEDPDHVLTLDVLRSWKSEYSKLYVSKITEDPIIYIWRPLYRLEYRRLIGTGKNDGTCNWGDDFSRQPAIIKQCLLFPVPTDNWIRQTRAGILPTLEQQILNQSGFISSDIALASIDVVG